MRKGTKIVFIIAIVCIVLGAVLCLSTLAMIDMDFSRLNTTKYTSKTQIVSENFSNIDIDAVEADICLMPSSDNTCSVVCPQGDSITHTVTVENDTLIVQRVDSRKWHEHIGIFWNPENDLVVTVYLPLQKYTALTLKSTSGDISVPGQFSFSQAEISTTSGDIDYRANNGVLSLTSTSGSIDLSEINAAELKVTVTSGDVDLQASAITSELYIKALSGEIEAEHVTAGRLMVGSTSGDIDLSHVLVSDQMELDSTSGEITLDRCDAQTLQLHSTSGNIFGILLTEKQFVTSTTSGTIRVPASSGIGACQVSTTSGNITFQNP